MAYPRTISELEALSNAPLSTLPPISAHDRLLRDLLLFVEDASNQFADDCHDHMARRADELFVRIQRQLEG